MDEYKVRRQDVYAGCLLKISSAKVEVYNAIGEKIEQDKLEEYMIPKVTSGTVCRNILFNINEYGLAHDLIYTTPINYKIEGVKPTMRDLSSFIITHHVNLDELLQYLKYDEALTQNDLDKIYRKLIDNSKWTERHLKLFGLKRTNAGYENHGEQVLTTDLYNNLSLINNIKGKPYEEEPGYSYIKRRK